MRIKERWQRMTKPLSARMGTGGIAALAAGLMAGCLFGCSLSHAPQDWLPARTHAGEDPFGAWIDVWFDLDQDPQGGELIAVQVDSLFLLGKEGLRSIAWKDAAKYRVAFYRSEGAHQGMIVFTSTLGTLSHGFIAGISGSTWLVVGGLTAALAPLEPIYSSGPWQQFAPFARFPQGLPPTLDRGQLRQKLPAPEKSRYSEPYLPMAIAGILQAFVGLGMINSDLPLSESSYNDGM